MIVSAVCGVTVTEPDSKEPIVPKVGKAKMLRGEHALSGKSVFNKMFSIFAVMRTMPVLEAY